LVGKRALREEGRAKVDELESRYKVQKTVVGGTKHKHLRTVVVLKKEKMKSTLETAMKM